MSVSDKLRRYFVANPAPVFQVRRLNLKPTKFIRCRCGNSGGFFWGRWRVTWRIPYADVWAFDGRRWVPASTLRPPSTKGE